MDVLLIFVPGGESSLACSGWVNVEHCGTINIRLTFDLERATQIYLIVVICRCLRPCQKREEERGGETNVYKANRDATNHGQWKVTRSGLSR